MKISSVFILLVLPVCVFSQPRFWVAPSAALNVFTLKPAPGFDHTYTSPEISARGGVDLRCYLSRRSAITTGLHYYSIRYEAEYAFIFIDANDPLIPNRSEVRAGYLDIPVIYNLQLAEGERWAVYSLTGISASFLVFSQNRTVFEDGNMEESGNLNDLLFNINMGAGVQYKCNDRVRVGFEPQLRLFLRGFDPLMYQYPTAYSGSLSLAFLLNGE